MINSEKTIRRGKWGPLFAKLKFYLKSSQLNDFVFRICVAANKREDTFLSPPPPLFFFSILMRIVRERKVNCV